MARTKSSPSTTPTIMSQSRQFVALAVVGLTISSLLYTVISPFTKGDLATVSRHRDTWFDIAGLLTWKTVELALGWWAGYDTTDLAALTLLSHLPYQFFLVTFYKIRPTTAATTLTVDIVAFCLPFYLFRAQSAYHKLHAPRGQPNRIIIDDLGVQISTTLLASGIYGAVVFGCFVTWLPKYLVIHFDGLRDLSAIYDSSFLSLAAFFAPVGYAAKAFLFTPFMAEKETEPEAFDPITATLQQTLVHNLLPKTKKTRALFQRTVALIIVSSVHTFLHTYGAVEGAESIGALGWSSVWALAATLTSVAYAVVGDV